MTPQQRKAARNLLNAFDDASIKVARLRNDRANQTVMMMARFGGEALHFLRAMLEEEDKPAHKQEGTQAEFDRYIAGDR